MREFRRAARASDFVRPTKGSKEVMRGVLVEVADYFVESFGKGSKSMPKTTG
jgi:hypothetical protein